MTETKSQLMPATRKMLEGKIKDLIDNQAFLKTRIAAEEKHLEDLKREYSDVNSWISDLSQDLGRAAPE
jgi:cell division protein FtsB